MFAKKVFRYVSLKTFILETGKRPNEANVFRITIIIPISWSKANIGLYNAKRALGEKLAWKPFAS